MIITVKFIYIMVCMIKIVKLIFIMVFMIDNWEVDIYYGFYDYKFEIPLSSRCENNFIKFVMQVS